MVTKPASTPRWANAQTDPDALTTIPTAGELDQGWHTSQKPPASYFNWFMNLVYQWIAYLDAQAFEGDLDVENALTAGTIESDDFVNATGHVSAGTYVSTSEADIRHGTRTRVIDLTYINGSIGWTSDGDTLSCLAATTGVAVVPLPLAIGERFLAARLIGKSASGAASDLSLRIRKLTATPGAASGSNSDAVATVNSTATANIQTVTCTPGAPVTVVADESMKAHIGAAATAGTKSAYRLEVDFDRVA